MSEEELVHKAVNFAQKYSKDIIGEGLLKEIKHIAMIHKSNFDTKHLGALEMLNALTECKLESLFPNLSVSFRIFLTAPATVASAERSFSKLKIIKNYPRSTMSHDGLNDLTKLSIDSDIAKHRL